MAKKQDKIYVFSVADFNFGRIVASVDKSGKRTDGENVFELLGISEEEKSSIKAMIFGYGKRPYAALCGSINKRAAIFFKHFAYHTSLCLAIVPSISAKRTANILSCGAFGDFVVSDSLRDMACKGSCEDVLGKDREGYLHFTWILGQIMNLLELKLQYSSEALPSVRPAAEGLAELLGITLYFDACFENGDDLAAVDEIYDGRFCAAAMLVCFITASKRSSNGTISLSEVRGLGGVRIEISFPCQRRGSRDPILYVRSLAELSHGISFDVEERTGEVTVRFVPFYQDVGFVGVKNGDEIFDIVAYKELY